MAASIDERREVGSDRVGLQGVAERGPKTSIAGPGLDQAPPFHHFQRLRLRQLGQIVDSDLAGDRQQFEHVTLALAEHAQAKHDLAAEARTEREIPNELEEIAVTLDDARGPSLLQQVTHEQGDPAGTSMEVPNEARSRRAVEEDRSHLRGRPEVEGFHGELDHRGWGQASERFVQTSVGSLRGDDEQPTIGREVHQQIA